MSDWEYPFRGSYILDEEQWEEWETNMHGVPDGVKRGIYGEFEVTPASSGLVVNVAGGVAVVRGFYARRESVKPLTLQPPDTANPRIDLVVLRRSKSSGGFVRMVIAGEAAAAPVAPVPAQDNDNWDLPLAEVYVAANAQNLGASDITDRRIWMSGLAQHASRHAIGGSDPLTPADIGAARASDLASTQNDLDDHKNNRNNPHNVTPYDMVPGDLVARIKLADGAGSGLDADFLRGLAPDAFATEDKIDDRFNANTASEASTRDWNTLTEPGVSDYLMRSDAPNGPPIGVARYFYVLVVRYADRVVQVAYPYIATTVDDTIWMRTYYVGTWSAWRKVWDSGAILHIAGDGECVRFPSGLQICWAAPVSVEGGSNYTWTFPAVFFTVPAVSGHAVRDGDFHVYYNVTTTTVTWRALTTGGHSGYLMAIGRWK